MKETGLRVDIYRNARSGYDCTNGGVSSKAVEGILVGDGIEGPNEPREGQVVFRLVKRMLGGKPYFHAEPDVPVPAGHVGYMFGGNFLYTSDSRLRRICEYPIPIHDRSEVPHRGMD